MTGTKQSCSCDKCRSACNHKPGWFLPGEAEKVAIFYEISMGELFKTKLMVDWWDDDDVNTFILSPALQSGETGAEFPADPRGKCIFYTDAGLCEIHSVKPFECREMIHDEAPGDMHKQVADKWKPHQNQIQKLLKRKPFATEFTIFDYLLRR